MSDKFSELVKETLGVNFVFTIDSVGLHLVGDNKEDKVNFLLLHLNGTASDNLNNNLAIIFANPKDVIRFSEGLKDLVSQMESEINDNGKSESTGTDQSEQPGTTDSDEH